MHLGRQKIHCRVWNACVECVGVVLQAGDGDPGRQEVMGAWATAELCLTDHRGTMEKAEGGRNRDR